jgi:hypothetical protein
MSSSLETAWTSTLGTLLGPTGAGDDGGIMAAQLERAVLILAHPSIASGALFETEPASFYATLEAHSVAAASTVAS